MRHHRTDSDRGWPRRKDRTMELPHLRSRRTWAPLSMLAVLGVGAWLTLSQAPAQALTAFDTPAPVTGNASWFTGLGAPYGGCGMTQDALETQNFVALNVYDTPGDTTFYQRPMAASLALSLIHISEPTRRTPIS